MNADPLVRRLNSWVVWAFLGCAACSVVKDAPVGEVAPKADVTTPADSPTAREPGGTGEGPLNYVSPAYWSHSWLAAAQEAEGSWDAKNWGAKKLGPLGATSLALLAFHSVCFTEKGGRFRAHVAKALDWLQAQQRADGSFPWQAFEEQGMATLALSEAYAMTEVASRGQAAQRALDYVCKTQPAHGGFGDRGACAWRDMDAVVTAWQVLALRSGMLAKLKVPDVSVQRVHAFLAKVRTTGPDAAKSSRTGPLGVVSAVACCRVLFETKEGTEKAREAADFILKQESREGAPIEGGLTAEAKSDLYYRWFSGLTMLRFGGPQGDHWKAWKTIHMSALVAAQVWDKEDAQGRPVRGSWDPARYTWGDQGGHVFATSLAILTLTVPFRFLPLTRLGWSVE